MRRPPPSLRRRGRTSAGLHVEALEARRLLATITVTGTGDTIANDGIVTLREAITAANTNAASGDATAGDAGLDTIAFNIPGAGVHTIRLTSDLPTITDRVVIDGYTQGHATSDTSGGAQPNTNPVTTGSNAVLLIELAPSSGFGSSGLSIAASNCTVRGLAINRFVDGIALLPGSGGDTIAGNYLGTDPAGTTALGNVIDLSVESPNNTIGGTSPADRNLISGGTNVGIHVPMGASRSGTVIQGNFIGTDATGIRALPNGIGVSIEGGAGATIGGAAAGVRNLISGNVVRGVYLQEQVGDVIRGNIIGADVSGTARLGNGNYGLYLFSGHDNTVGGTSAGSGNVIAANAVGLRIDTASGTLVQGNFIGTDVTGTIDLGNSVRGVSLAGQADRNTIGGTAAGAGNVIAFSPNGVGLDGYANAVLGNSIFGNQVEGIIKDAILDFLPLPPELTSATGTSIAGTQRGLPGATFRLEFFATPDTGGASNRQGKTFLGATDVTGDGAGLASFTFAPPGGVPAGRLLTATATDPTGTSVFSLALTGAAAPAAPTNVVPSLQTAADGSISLTIVWSHSSPVGSGVTFNVYRSTTPGGEGQVPLIGNLATRSLHDAGVVPGSTYYYQVSAVAGGVESPRSAEVSVAVPALPALPTYRAFVSSETSTDVRITIKPAVAHTSPPGSSWNLYRSAKPGQEGTVPFAERLSIDTYGDAIDKGHSAQTFYYQLSELVNGVEGPRSNEVAVTVPALAVPPAPHYDGSYLDRGPVNGSIRVAPVESNPDFPVGSKFNFYRSTTPGGEGATPYQSGGSYVLFEDRPRARDAQRFYFQVSVTVDGVAGPRSNEVAVTVPALAVPPAPHYDGSYLDRGPVNGSIRVAPVESNPDFPVGSKFNFYRSTTPGGEGATPYQSGGSYVLFEDRPRARDAQRFYFQVSVTVDGVAGPRSNEVAVTVPALAVPPAPHYDGSYLGRGPVNGSIRVAPVESNPDFPVGSKFNFYRSTTPGGEGATPYQSGGSYVLFEDRPRARDAQRFYFQVSVTVDGVAGPRSNEVAVTVPALAVPPAPHYDGSYLGRGPVNGSIRVAPVESNPDFPVGSKFNFYRSTTPGGEGATPYQSGGSYVLFEDRPRARDAQRFYFQVSVTVDGVAGPRSNEVAVTVPALAVPPAPNVFGYFAVGGPRFGHFYLDASYPYGSVAQIQSLTPGAYFRIYMATTPQGEGPQPIATALVNAPWVLKYNLQLFAKTFYFQESLVLNGVEGPLSREVQVTVPALKSLGNSKHVVVVTSLYSEFLHRSPDPADLGFWADVLRSGVPLRVVAKAIQASPEARSLSTSRP